MYFVFYPKHQYGCPHVSHCPHLGGASLGSLVLAAEEQTDWTNALLRQIDGLREEKSAQHRQIEALIAELGQTKRELKAERQKQFKSTTPDEEVPAEGNEPQGEAKKRGVPWDIRAGFGPLPRTSTARSRYPCLQNVPTAKPPSRRDRICRRVIIFKRTSSRGDWS